MLSRLASRCSSSHSFSSCLTSTRNIHLPRIPRGATRRWLHDELPRSDAQKATIYALSTPPGKGGVGVIRISGSDANLVWKSMVKPYASSSGTEEVNPTPWKLQRCRIVHPTTSSPIDDGLAVYFRAPRSFTSEDVVELHLHSGRAVIAAALSALASIPTCRSAEPGEFTRRAYLSGRMDLTQVEGLKDLIDAETEGQRKVALQAVEGVTRQKFDELRKGIISALAKVEALIDFGEGEEIEEGVFEEARTNIRAVHETIQGYLNDHRRGELLRSGIKLAIFGPPNAGKSSLLNFLVQREAAIVTPIPGTTRDVMELSLDIGGLPVIISDTAGLRKTDDVVEKIGIERARKAVQESDVSICVLSLPDAISFSQSHVEDGPAQWKELISPNTFFLFNKSDLANGNLSSTAPTAASLRDALLPRHEGQSSTGPRAWIASLATGAGAEAFLEGFSGALKERFGMDDAMADSNTPLITRSRHRDHLHSASLHLEQALTYGPDDVVFAAEELRYAASAVGKVTGAIGVEDVLDALFRDFCIGK